MASVKRKSGGATTKKHKTQTKRYVKGGAPVPGINRMALAAALKGPGAGFRGKSLAERLAEALASDSKNRGSRAVRRGRLSGRR